MSKTTTNNIQLNISEKQVYTINGNKDNFIKLNPNDMGIVTRYNASIKRFQDIENNYVKLMQDMAETANEENELDFEKFSEVFNETDKEMREAINFLFDYDVCSVCAKDGSVFDLTDGEYAYIVIIETLLELYSSTIAEEMKKLTDKMKKHTNKYTTNDHKRSVKKGTK